MIQDGIGSLRQTQIDQNSRDTQDDLQHNQDNDNPFESLAVGRVDTLLQELEHILQDLSGSALGPRSLAVLREGG